MHIIISMKRWPTPRIVPAFLFVCALAFVIAGLALGDMELVFKKAVFICLECIGIG